MNFIHILKLIVLGLAAVQTEDVDCVDRQITQDFAIGEYFYIPQCVGFTIGSGIGCNWMCKYCHEQLNTTNYFFADDVCKYDETGGCQGEPNASVQYTCCAN